MLNLLPHCLGWVKQILGIIIASILLLATPQAADYYISESGQRVLKPLAHDWSFASPFGVYDRGQLQRGLQVYSQICASCHSLKQVKFRDLVDLGYDEDQLKLFAGRFLIRSIDPISGKVITRPAELDDNFQSPFLNADEARAANGGMLPPDLSLIIRARNISSENFIGQLAHYNRNLGADYVYSLLLGYRPAPDSINNAGHKFYNPWFIKYEYIAMPPPLADNLVKYGGGVEETIEQYAADVTAFLVWAGDPHLVIRKKTGFRVLVFLFLFAITLYLLKRKIWR